MQRVRYHYDPEGTTSTDHHGSTPTCTTSTNHHGSNTSTNSPPL
jgi:hypothetical protein